MKTLLEKIYSLSGSIYIPKDIVNNHSLILHISDTPPSTYGAIEKLIHKINPLYIVHTGNFTSNNFKMDTLQYNEDYSKTCHRLIDILENSSAKEIYGVYGNFDYPELLTRQSSRITWIDEYADLLIDGINFRISHTPQYAASTEAQFSLFGHDLEILSYQTKEHSYLNGIESINLIATDSKLIARLDYPIGTNETRQNLIHVSL